ncbi:hypothetical protein ACLOJK_032369 [Asimina triloba]
MDSSKRVVFLSVIFCCRSGTWSFQLQLIYVAWIPLAGLCSTAPLAAPVLFRTLDAEKAIPKPHRARDQLHAISGILHHHDLIIDPSELNEYLNYKRKNGGGGDGGGGGQFDPEGLLGGGGGGGNTGGGGGGRWPQGFSQEEHIVHAIPAAGGVGTAPSSTFSDCKHSAWCKTKATAKTSISAVWQLDMLM